MKFTDKLTLTAILLTGLILSGCYTSPKSTLPRKFAFKSNAVDFITSISEHTIVFGTGVRVTEGGDSFFTGIGKPGMSSSLYPGFPLKISATIVTEDIVNNAGDYFSKLLDLNDAETDSFMNAYRKTYDVENNNLIWIYMKTNLAESYLSPERWVIFVEDEEQNQFEPFKLQQIHPMIEDTKDDRKNNWRSLRIKETQFALQFPKEKFDGHPWIPEKGKLKLVFMNPDKNIERADGTWFLGED